MSEEKYPNISAVIGVVDGALGCVFGLIKLAAWLFLILLIFTFFSELSS